MSFLPASRGFSTRGDSGELLGNPGAFPSRPDANGHYLWHGHHRATADFPKGIGIYAGQCMILKPAILQHCTNCRELFPEPERAHIVSCGSI